MNISSPKKETQPLKVSKSQTAQPNKYSQQQKHPTPNIKQEVQAPKKETLNKSNNKSKTTQSRVPVQMVSKAEEAVRAQNNKQSTPGYDKYVKKHTKFNYYCPVCTFTANGSHEFSEHCLIQHKKTIFMCLTEDCVKFYETQNGLHLHCKQKHENVLKCLVCGLICLSPDLLEKHHQGHNVVKNFNCSQCDKKFSSAYDKNRHWKYHCPENPNRVFKCKHCIAQGVEADVEGAEIGLLNHLIEKHGFTGQYMCLFCHKLFLTDKKLQNHNKTCSHNHPDK